MDLQVVNFLSAGFFMAASATITINTIAIAWHMNRRYGGVELTGRMIPVLLLYN